MYRVFQNKPPTLGTSYSETTNLWGVGQQGVLMSTPCSQSLRPNRLVVSEYEVPNVLVSQKWGVYSETPGIYQYLLVHHTFATKSDE